LKRRRRRYCCDAIGGGRRFRASVAIESSECRNRKLTTNNLRQCVRHRLSSGSAHSLPGASDVPGMLRAVACRFRSEDTQAHINGGRARAICGTVGRRRSRTPADAVAAAQQQQRLCSFERQSSVVAWLHVPGSCIAMPRNDRWMSSSGACQCRTSTVKHGTKPR